MILQTKPNIVGKKERKQTNKKQKQTSKQTNKQKKTATGFSAEGTFLKKSFANECLFIKILRIRLICDETV